MSSSSLSASRQRRLYRAQSLLSEIISARASLGQLPQETAELPLTGLMGSEVGSPHVDLSSDLEDALLEFAPARLSPLGPTPLEGEAGHFMVDDELRSALLEASAAHTGETDERSLMPSSDLEAALHEALEDVGEPEAPMVAQPTPIAYHPNQPAPMRALWGRRGFTPTPELKPQAELQATAPRLAFEESQELLELVDFAQVGRGADDLSSGEDMSSSGLVEHDLETEPSAPEPSDQAPLFTAAYAPLGSEVELSEVDAPEEAVTQDASAPSPDREALPTGEAMTIPEGFGGVSSSPDEPKPEVLEQAWTELASPSEHASRGRSIKLWLVLILLALGAAGVYYYVRFML